MKPQPSKRETPRIPTKRNVGAPSTMRPERLSMIVQSVLAGDTVRAACGSAAVAETTYKRWMQLGVSAVNSARSVIDDQDVEGAVWQFIQDHGGHQNLSPKAEYWTAKPPAWFPATLEERWLNVVFAVLVYWARGQAERVYRQAITTAAIGGDWKAAEFMLTHSFGWSKTDRVEVTGADGGAIQMQGDEDATLAVLARLAKRRRAIEE